MTNSAVRLPHELSDRINRHAPRRHPGVPRASSTRFGSAQQAGEKRFSSLVQLLETKKGERLVRFAYATDGTARRGPVTLRARDLDRLRVLLEKHPDLQETLRL